MQSRSRQVDLCSEHGVCRNTMGSYKCICNEYFYGKSCEYAHICEPTENPCQNGATCMVSGDGLEDNMYECKCLHGYTGINCSYPTCDLLPCQHDSICNMINSTAFECNCTGTGFAGLLCENKINIEECRQRACFGNQTCDPMKCDCDLSLRTCEEVIFKTQ